jgi:hypothetical protein
VWPYILQIYYNTGKRDSVLCRHATMQVRCCILQMLHCSTYVAALLCGTAFGWHKRIEQCITDGSLVLINIQQAGFLQQSISWSSPVSSSEHHLSVRKYGRNLPSRTVPQPSFTTILFCHSLPSFCQPYTMMLASPWPQCPLWRAQSSRCRMLSHLNDKQIVFFRSFFVSQ